MANQDSVQYSLKGKLLITGVLKILTGMHIGGSSDFAPIGSVDSPFIRDVLTHQPIVPGSSLKGKIRTLLVRSLCDDYKLNDIKDDKLEVKRLFGSSEPVVASRLQFFDLFLTENTVKKFSELDTDTYIGEVKFENTIGRLSGVANPRQIERVPAGAEFVFKLVYNVEREEDVKKDLEILAKGLKLLETDYLGGHGSRGYGRVAFGDFKVKKVGDLPCDEQTYVDMLK